MKTWMVHTLRFIKAISSTLSTFLLNIGKALWMNATVSLWQDDSLKTNHLTPRGVGSFVVEST